MTAYPELEEAKASWRHQPAPNCLSGKAILVTGAGSGIGQALAKSAALYGANVILLGRTRAKLEAVFDWIGEHTATRPVIVPCDLSQLGPGNAESLASQARAEYGRLDGLVHNAAVLGAKTPLAHYPMGQWEEVLRVNLTAAATLTQALLPLMLETAATQQRQGSILFTASTVGRQGRAYWGAYAVSKFAVEGLMQVLADECAAEGKLRVNSLNPGATRSALRRQAYPAENPAEVPLPEARLDIYMHLLSDAAVGVTGQALDARTWPSAP